MNQNRTDRFKDHITQLRYPTLSIYYFWNVLEIFIIWILWYSEITTHNNFTRHDCSCSMRLMYYGDEYKAQLKCSIKLSFMLDNGRSWYPSQQQTTSSKHYFLWVKVALVLSSSWRCFLISVCFGSFHICIISVSQARSFKCKCFGPLDLVCSCQPPYVNDLMSQVYWTGRGYTVMEM